MIRAGSDNNLMSSFLLWSDHITLFTGSAFTNWGSPFYRISGYNQYHTYAAPYRPFVADSSIPGATIMTGIYLNNTFIGTGQSGFVGINYDKGLVYFAGAATGSISGDYAVKDFTFTLTDKPEERLTIETKHFIKPRVGETVTGLQLDKLTFPCIYIKNNGSQNTEFAFGGLEKDTNYIRMIVMADSLYSRDAITSLFKNRVRTNIGIFSSGDMPFDSLGRIKGSGLYNYRHVVQNKNGTGVFHINSVKVSVFNQESFQNLTALNSDVFVSLIDAEICQYNFPRFR